MKKISIVLHSRSVLSVDWNSLLETATNHQAILVLVCSQESYSHLSAQDKQSGLHSIVVNDFSFSTLKEALNEQFSSLYEPGDETRIATLSEFDMTASGQLRDHFREKYNVIGPGSEIIDNFRDKLKMKEILGAKGVKIPSYIDFNSLVYQQNPTEYLSSIEKKLGYPMFAKPTDSAGSIGTCLIQNHHDLRAFTEKASQESQGYEIDEYVEGDLYHCDSIIQNGQVLFTFVNRYLNPNAEARAGKILGSMNMDLQSRESRELIEFTEHTLKQFPKLPDGITHLEVFKNKQGELIFLEVAARPAGAKVREMYLKRTHGVDFSWLHLRLNFGFGIEKQLAQLQDESKWGPYTAMFQMLRPEETGILMRKRMPKFSNSQYDITWYAEEGDTLSPNESVLDTIFSSLMWNNEFEALEKDYQSLNQQRLIEVVKPAYLRAFELFYELCQWCVEDNEAYFPKNALPANQNLFFYNRQINFPTSSTMPTQLPQREVLALGEDSFNLGLASGSSNSANANISHGLFAMAGLFLLIYTFYGLLFKKSQDEEPQNSVKKI